MTLVIACLLTVTGVYAEKADRSKPINIEADRVTVDDAKQISIFEGNVSLTQGTMLIRGDRMEVRQDKNGFKYGTAWGSLAYFKQKREGYDELIEGWAERIEYDGRADKVQLFNRAALKKVGDEVRGNYISYDVATELSQVLGGGTKAATPDNPNGRVRAVIQPKSKEPISAPSTTLNIKSDKALPMSRPDLVTPTH
jgi:lipopolysaccharide export system protein LptA